LKIYSGEVADNQRRFLTGYSNLDKALGGFATSEFSVFMGATGIGKTTLLINLSYGTWVTSSANILFFSLEMPVIQVMRRLDSRILNIPYDDLKYKTIKLKSDEFYAKYGEVINNLSSRTNTFKVIDLPPRSSVRKMEEYILTSKVKPDIIVVDYIGLVGVHSGKRMEGWEEKSEIALDLKYLAKRYHIAVVTVSQVTAEAVKREDTKIDGYQSYDVSGAKAIAHHADLLIGVQYDPDLKIMSFNSPKVRDGMGFNMQLFADLSKCHVFEVKP
jgi:replicative DNA helicase